MKYRYECAHCGATRTSPIKVTMSHECPVLKKKYPPSKSIYWASQFKLMEEK